MSFRIVTLGRHPVITDYQDVPVPPVLLGEKGFHEVDVDDDPVFYDFVVGPECDIRALQLQLGRDDPISARLVPNWPENRHDYIEFSPCLRIWLGQARQGREAGLEAFGDLLILEADDGTRAVGFSTSWLSGIDFDCSQVE